MLGFGMLRGFLTVYAILMIVALAILIPVISLIHAALARWVVRRVTQYQPPFRMVYRASLLSIGGYVFLSGFAVLGESIVGSFLSRLAWIVVWSVANALITARYISYSDGTPVGLDVGIKVAFALGFVMLAMQILSL